jgi:hypothetical protein
VFVVDAGVFTRVRLRALRHNVGGSGAMEAAQVWLALAVGVRDIG